MLSDFKHSVITRRISIQEVRDVVFELDNRSVAFSAAGSSPDRFILMVDMWMAGDDISPRDVDRPRQWRFCFEDPNEAMLFKLAWT